jgi:hypothetical protein
MMIDAELNKITGRKSTLRRMSRKNEQEHKQKMAKKVRKK